MADACDLMAGIQMSCTQEQTSHNPCRQLRHYYSVPGRGGTTSGFKRTWLLFLSGGNKDKEGVKTHSNDDNPTGHGCSQDFLEGGAILEATQGEKCRNFIPETTPLTHRYVVGCGPISKTL